MLRARTLPPEDLFCFTVIVDADTGYGSNVAA
jgi:hypothetical protein